MQPDQQRLEQLDAGGPHPVDAISDGVSARSGSPAATVHGSYRSACCLMTGSRSLIFWPLSWSTKYLNRVKVDFGLTSSPVREPSHWVRNSELRLMVYRPSADLGLPELRFERPVLGVGALHVDAFGFQPLEDEVLDQIGGGERGAACVEGLEDLLGVLLAPEVDRHQLQSPGEHLDQRVGPCGELVRCSSLPEPLDDRVDEEPVSSNQQRPGVLERRRGRPAARRP